MKDFRDLQVWHKAHVLVLDAYKITDGFPKQEMFGINEPDTRGSRFDRDQHRGRLRKTW